MYLCSHGSVGLGVFGKGHGSWQGDMRKADTTDVMNKIIEMMPCRRIGSMTWFCGCGDQSSDAVMSGPKSRVCGRVYRLRGQMSSDPGPELILLDSQKRPTTAAASAFSLLAFPWNVFVYFGLQKAQRDRRDRRATTERRAQPGRTAPTKSRHAREKMPTSLD
jgi:hypothetical protein